MTDARQQIHDALLSYCRGIDRLRPDDVSAGFHDGATLDGYGAGPMTIEDFASYATVALGKRFTATQHRITNTRIEFGDDDATALVETYVEASHVEPATDETPQRLHLFAGRYIDRCEPDADGVWKIASRTLRNDWSRVDTISEPMSGSYVPSGRGETPDPLFDA
jgi:SnoaL-like domain